MKANLSRIHTLIAQTGLDIKRRMAEAERPLRNGSDFNLQVLESTTDADIQGFVARLGDKKAEIENIFSQCDQALEYSFYLREKLDEGNRSSGVAELLLKQNNVGKKLERLRGVRQIIERSCSQGLTEVKDAEYYKASFSINQKVYFLSLKMFSEADYQKIQAEIDAAERDAFAIGDQIAFLNQTTVIDILSFEEFQKRK